MNRYLITPALLLCLSPAQAITIDGDWSDWINPSGNGQADDWNPIDPSLKYQVEDQSTNYLDPGYGGQVYDAEAIYVDASPDGIAVAVFTGRNPKYGYPWGDIALDFGMDGTFEYGLVTWGYEGYATRDNQHHRGEGIGSPGDVYRVDDWLLGIWDAPDDHNDNPTSDYAKAHPTAVKSGTLLGSGQFAYSKVTGPLGELGGDHWFMEGLIPASLIDPQFQDQAFLAHWTMGCANDWIQVDPVINSVPEASALWLIGPGLGLAALVGWRRRNGQG
ncbi:MAG: PEP-CTERM sorting domain-containing protein [Gammaproteobacteria bacterium]|nr:MAG: PEP-CTERM sorting domain-containing protein [Gammaproteobacteria bacterium]